MSDSANLTAAPGLLGTISQTPAVGRTATGNKSDFFNDLVEYGNFPIQQNIEKIIKIELWVGDRVSGIKPTYALTGSSTISKLHGIETSGSDHYSFDIKGNQWIVGAFGYKDIDGYISRLSFVIFDANNGTAVIQNSGGPPTNGKVTPFGTFGQIIAFAGTENSSNGLTTLSFMKDSAKGGPVVLF